MINGFPCNATDCSFPLRTYVGSDLSSPIMRLLVQGFRYSVQCSFGHKQGGFAPCSGLRKITLRIEFASFKAKYVVFKRPLCHLQSSELCKVPSDASGVSKPESWSTLYRCNAVNGNCSQTRDYNVNSET